MLRYTVNNKPVERLLELIPCEHIVELLTGAVRICRCQTMDGAGNMAGRQTGCAALFAKHASRAVHHCCSSHDLNLALGKSC